MGSGDAIAIHSTVMLPPSFTMSVGWIVGSWGVRGQARSGVMVPPSFNMSVGWMVGS